VNSDVLNPFFLEGVQQQQNRPFVGNACLRSATNKTFSKFCGWRPQTKTTLCADLSTLQGVACATAGVEVVFLMGGMAVTPGDDANTMAQNKLNMIEARQTVIDALFTQGYLKPVSSAALLLEGVKAYPIEMVKAVAEEPLSPLLGRSLWRIVLRAPDIHLDLSKMAGGSIFDNAATWQTLFADTNKYRINEFCVC